MTQAPTRTTSRTAGSDITHVSSHNSPPSSTGKDSAVLAAQTHPHPDPQHRTTWQSICIVATCTAAMILNTANSTAVSICLPTIGRELNIVQYKLQWIVSAFALSSGCLLLFFGRIADLYGRKRTFLVGIVILGAFGLGCGFAQDEITLDVLRGFQGVGAAACIPSALGILAHSFPPSRLRSIAFATFAAGAPVGAAIGSLVGGALTQLTAPTWRSTFYLMTGLSALCFVGGALYFDKDLPSTEKDRRIDWIGAFLVTLGLIMIVFVLSQGSIASNGWKTNYIIALIVVGVVLLLAFVVWERYLEVRLDRELANAENESSAEVAAKPQAFWNAPPLMRISIWARAKGMLGVMLLIACLEWCSFLSYQFWLILYYQNFLGLSPVLTMVRLIPMFITGVCCNIIVALVVGRIPVVILIVIGLLLTSVANLLFAVINPAAPYWAFGFPAAIASVFGADFVFASGTLFVAKVCLPHEQSVGGALFQTLTQLGTALGIAVSTIVFNTELGKAGRRLGVDVNKAGTNAPRAAQLTAYKDAMWTGFAFGVAGAVLALIVLRGAGIVGHRAPPPKAEGLDAEKAPVAAAESDVRDEKRQQRGEH